MGRKAYLADIETVKASRLHGFLPGPDGEFTFLYTNPKINIRINAMIPDTSEYPEDHQCMLFLNDDAPLDISERLESCPNVAGLSIQRILATVTQHLGSPRKRPEDITAADGTHDQEADDSDSFEPEALDEADSEDAWGFDDDMMDDHHDLTKDPVSFEQSTTTASPQSLLHDFQAAKEAGFKVGAFGNTPQTHGRYFSLARRISKLGITEEAMQAWQVKPSNYLVLLLHYPYGYKSLREMEKMDSNTVRQYLLMRVGQCTSYKPASMDLVRKAFAKNVDDNVSSYKENATDRSTALQDTLISKPLNELLNKRLMTLIRMRLAHTFGWPAAEALFRECQDTSAPYDSVYFRRDFYQKLDQQEHNPDSDVVDEDALAGNYQSELVSLPLVAIQYTLRHFVRCPQFCQVCYKKLENSFEAIKPYVCDNTLCLYQYMSLGFGPSIEHEIVNQPYVVDLLVSFCYQGASRRSLRSYPKGLGWSVPPVNKYNAHDQDADYPFPVGSNLPYSSAPLKKQKVDEDHVFRTGSLDRRDLRLQINTTNTDESKTSAAKKLLVPFRTGDWIVIDDVDVPSNPTWHCRVLERCQDVVLLSSPVVQSLPSIASYENKDAATAPLPNTAKVHVQAYDINFDSLNDENMAKTIVLLLNLIPSVNDMRAFLIDHPGSLLSSWTSRLPLAVWGLLRWIIASNRACILQIDEAPTKGAEDPDEAVHTVRPDEERVKGMPGWLQFRFAMGAPDKEERFIKAVNAESSSQQHPTIFAWHGSPVNNWHSIIRHGLDFQTVAHGRAFGDGVYHARDLPTSLGYSSRGGYVSWPSSSLKITTAVALSEIVNAPNKFRCNTPCIVVQHLDWIQTRYLFVKSDRPIQTAAEQDLSETLPSDPSSMLIGDRGLSTKVELPVSAVPKSRRPGNDGRSWGQRLELQSKRGKSASLKEVIDLTTPDGSDTESIATLAEDVSFLKAPEQKPTKKSTIPVQPVTCFRVQSHTDLPLLGSPLYATSLASKRLQRDLMTLRNTQEAAINAGTLSDLGWYVDPDHLARTGNLYQWIISLHSFPLDLPLGQDMKAKGIESVILEVRFAATYPISPPFVRVIRPRFLPFRMGGGGHVTVGGSICMDLLTNSGWTAVSDLESVLLQIRMALMSTDPRPARLENTMTSKMDYGVGEAVEAFIRVARDHDWKVPDEVHQVAAMSGIAST